MENDGMKKMQPNKDFLTPGPGGKAQWTSHPPQEQKIWVRFPPGYKILREKIAIQMSKFD
jgi:hypothetical protein